MPRVLRSPRQRRLPRSLLPVRITSYRSTIPARSISTEPSRTVLPVVTSILTPGRPVARSAHNHHLPSSNAIVAADRLSLTLPVPPSINHQYATVNGRRLLSAVGRSYKALVGQQVLLALAGTPQRTVLLKALHGENLALSIRFYFTSRLRRDVDGGLKIAQDALCEAIGINDNRIIETHLFKDADRNVPRIEISLSTVPAGISPASMRS